MEEKSPDYLGRGSVRRCCVSKGAPPWLGPVKCKIAKCKNANVQDWQNCKCIVLRGASTYQLWMRQKWKSVSLIGSCTIAQLHNCTIAQLQVYNCRLHNCHLPTRFRRSKHKSKLDAAKVKSCVSNLWILVQEGTMGLGTALGLGLPVALGHIPLSSTKMTKI